MRKKRAYMLGIIAVILILLLVKGIMFFMAEPKVTEDFYAKYNIVTKPLNYDPNDNAEPEYRKAFETFTRMPGNLISPYISWPSDFNTEDRKTFENWLNTNKTSLEFFRNASKKPYMWSEIYPLINRPLDERPNPPGTVLRLIEATLWNTKAVASTGQIKSAFENIIVCWKAGQHQCRTPSFIMEQSSGLSHKQMALATGFEILSRTKIGSAELHQFQNTLEKEFSEDKYIPDFEAERLRAYDELQRNFIDNGKGTGRLAWRRAKYFITLCIDQPNPYLACFFGPTRNEMTKRIEEIFASFEPLKTETPWQIHNRDPNYFERIKVQCEDFLISSFVINPSRVFWLYHQAKAQEQAILTTIAALRFKADNNRFPDMLNDLISADYLKSIPLDPYSDGPLIYKKTGDNFLLYSVGKDFEDNGGNAIASFGFIIRLSGFSVEHQDILFWPVKGFERREKYLAEPNDTNTVPAGP